jgi:flavin reductase (DIM6/NTAB) family NADH-FMN oxidoreductase RutF
MSFQPSELRQLLGHFATGVAVVTAEVPDGERAGVTINSFNSVSMSPELILFSLDRSLLSLPVFEAATHYGVNFLAAGQEEVSRRFASRGQEKWSETDWRRGSTGAPLLAGSLAHIECARHSVVEAGDHLIFLCRVLDFATSGSQAPLIFYRGRYHQLPDTSHAAATQAG